MTSNDALQSFIDSRIPPDLQLLYRERCDAYRAAWRAAVIFCAANAGTVDRDGRGDCEIVGRGGLAVSDALGRLD